MMLRLLLLCLFVPAAASAQMIPRSVEADAFGSYYAFMSRGGFTSDQTVKLENLKDMGLGGGRIGINFTEWIAFEATVGVGQTRTFDTLRDAWYVNSHFDAVFHLPFPYVIPYFAVGAGFQHFNIRPTYAAGNGPADFDRVYRDPYPDSERLDETNYISYRSADGDFLIDAGGGVKFLLYENTTGPTGFGVGVRLDARYKVSVGPADADDGVPTLEIERDPVTNQAIPLRWHGTFHHVELGGGVFVLFGGGTGPDKDRDGINNRNDKCVDEPEDKDGFEDEDGCPDDDNDGDGITDDVDQCVSDPEDKDGFEDEDGCPDLDNDGDGMTDERDQCPSRAEDEDGFEDNDGCPELDNDQDGWLDAEDACPNAAENFNSYLDDDGCPDQIPDDLAEFAGAIPAIQFQVNSDRLKRTARPVLDKAARVLVRYPDLAVEIGGHASSEGDDDYNMQLSQGRVVTVREYLIDRGVDADRLRAVGYGETRPIASNDSEAGRIANRRVEFKLSRLQD